ncbi:hypothetical protein HYW41_03710 [Candidatus Daviesbacteria bacterium]|nr:hypothetical protein [Candidatus Daviesbacteria bacterium]
MPTKLPGLFDSFDNLDAISIDSLILWLKEAGVSIPPFQLENYLANKILYPQTLPLTDIDMKIDLAILRQALTINGPKSSKNTANPLLGDNPFLNITLRKIIIPERFLYFVPDLVSLTWAFVDGLLLVDRQKEDWYEDLWTVILADDIDQIIGSVILPQFSGKSDSMDLFLQDRNFKIRAGNLTVVPCDKERCQIRYKLLNGKILGKNESSLEVYGGKLGLMIDGRIV